MKRCSYCGEPKPLEQFSKRSDTRDGKYAWCKPCQATNAKIWRASSRAWRVAALERDADEFDALMARSAAAEARRVEARRAAAG